VPKYPIIARKLGQYGRSSAQNGGGRWVIPLGMLVSRVLMAHQHRALEAGGRWFEPGTAHFSLPGAFVNPEI
jgi:hypothetical protein